MNLSRGGQHPIDFALRLGAGFGSQIAMALLRRIPGDAERIRQPEYQKWLSATAGYPDPETEVVIPRIKNDIIELFLATVNGELNKTEIDIDDRACTTIVLASKGYPEQYEKGKVT